MNQTDNHLHIYEISASYKKSTYQTEHWVNVLSNGKTVVLLVTNMFYWGTFEIELTDKEKIEILKKESIILNDYSVSCCQLDSGCDLYYEIKNEDKYTEQEMQELKKLIFWNENYYDDYFNSFL